MKPNPEFQNMPKFFWAAIRTLSQKCGYTVRGTGTVRVPSIREMESAYTKLGLSAESLKTTVINGKTVAERLFAYFTYRANTLNTIVKPQLMDATEARQLFEKLSKKLKPTCPIPMNKQKGNMKAPAFFTAIINMLIEANAGEITVDYDPRELTTVTNNGSPLRTLSRRVDGAFPSVVNPIAIWEIKEYYYTTTFGSRVADGVYETLLDGMELEELSVAEGVDVLHYLFLDARFTWWDCGRSYLCRIIDMLHMGYVDEVIVGREVVDRLPDLVKEWRNLIYA